MSASGGSSSCPTSGSGLGVRTNVSVTSINCINTISSMPSVAATSPSSSVTSSSPSATISNPSIATAVVTSTMAMSASTTSEGASNSTINNSSSNSFSNSLTKEQPSALHSNGNHFFGNGSIRISVPKMEESDESETELSHIESTAAAGVSMRSSINKTAPRPMSWEGELSESEDQMETDAMSTTSTSALTNSKLGEPSNENEPINVIAYAPNGSNAKNNHHHHHAMAPIAQQNDTNQAVHLIAKDEIKPELGDFTSSGGSDPSQTSSLYPNKRYPLDMSNVKFEASLQQQPSSHQYQQHQQTQPDAVNSPLLVRSKNTLLPTNPSPDSAIHSVYTHSSPSQSPLTSRHTPYTPSLSRNNSDASYSSCYSYSSEFSPTHSPIQGRHNMYSGGSFNGSPLHHSVLYKPMIDGGGDNIKLQQQQSTEENVLETEIIPSAGISRQQLINSPCPICGDKISGFHYGIFSCESCKGFFKRTVQNRKNYVCLRGGPCPITIATRKKCPACRFEKCLQRGMKLEAIREDRTRGGRSTYQCSYTLPMLSPSLVDGTLLITNNRTKTTNQQENTTTANNVQNRQTIPALLQEIMDVEHLWKYSEAEFNKLNESHANGGGGSSSSSGATTSNNASSAILTTNPLLASAGLANGDDSNPDLIATLCSVADHRLYKIVKWCKSLPLFKNISIDDQICLLINSWCELLLFSCCFRSISTPGEVRISLGKSINLEQAKSSGLQACIERMLNLTDHLRRLRVDKYEYVAMKVIVLLQSDTSDLREPEKVRGCQEKALQALQSYTLAHYPDAPSKFGELLLRIPELQRTCQVGKEMLTIKSKDGAEFNLLMELLRGEH